MLEPRFTFNARSLVLGRVLIGALVLYDLAVRCTALEAHYTDAGALPRDAYTLSQWDQLWSLHLLSGGAAFQALLFALTAAALVAFIVGWHVRVASVVVWLLYLSLCARNPLLRDGQDELTRVLLFFCMFMPLEGGEPRQVRSAGTIAFTLQVCVIYWSSVVHKLQSPWWVSLQALSNVMQMRRYQTSFAQWLTQFPSALELLTVCSVLLELLGPLALLVFWSRPRVRVLVIVAMCGLHLGMWSTIRIGTFPPLCVAMWLMFLPTAFWGGLVEAPAERLPRWASGLALSGVGLVLLMALQNVAHHSVTVPVNLAARAVGLQQWWGVFAPTPSEVKHLDDGWLWAQGRTATGELVTVDVPYFTSSADPPPLLRWKDTRWRHLFANLTVVSWPVASEQGRTQAKARLALTRWLCRDWNREHPDARLAQLYLFFFRHQLGHPSPATRELLASADDACSE